METAATHSDWIGKTVYSRQGDKIGSVDDVYFDDVTGRPDWFTVSTGWFGTSTQFVPITGTSPDADGNLLVDYTEDHIKDAPAVDDDAHLDADDERRLYAHYGLDYDADAVAIDNATAGRPRADEGYGYNANAASVVRSEEQLAVDKVEREAGRVRLRKYVVTEDVNMTIPVRKEVARIVREPLDAVAAGTIDVDAVDEEVVLKQEEVVVDKQVLAKERIGIETDVVTDEHTIDETVRKERVEVDGDTV